MADKRLGKDFIRDNWGAIAKFSYEHFLQLGHGAVVISDEDASLDNLTYVRASDIVAVIDGGDLIDSDGNYLAHVELLTYDNGQPRTSAATENERKRFEEFLHHDPDYAVSYLHISGQTVRLGQHGNSLNCPVRIYNVERNPEINYFSSNISLNDNPVIDRMSREHYSHHLQAMAEPVLALLQDEIKEVYRFLWLRSFHAPLAVRIEKDELDCFIFTKELRGMGGYYPKGIAKQSSNKLTAKQYRQAISLIEESNFWQSPIFRNDLALDGAEWVLEGYHEQKYHVVTRLSPNADGLDKDFRKVCLHLLKLSGAEIPDSEVY